MPLTLVTGPVRSGKSRFAERLASELSLPVTYVATARADAGDAEWAARIAHHAARRPATWTVLETADKSHDLARVLCDAASGSVLLVDSLGTWLGSVMRERLESRGSDAALDERELEGETERIAEACERTAATAIVVTEEVGWGIVPEFPSGRVFRDVLGRLNQRLARSADRAYLVVAGIALDLRAIGTAVQQ